MIVLREYFSAVVTEDEYLAGEGSNYNKLYIYAKNGKVYERVKLQNNGKLLHEVPAVPDTGVPTQIEEEIQFLPGGKIPFYLVQQIEAFFKDVMKGLGVSGHTNTAHGDYEAMIHILWNKTKGYFCAVPTQRVSKGSVHYENDHMSAEDMVVVDIHSHNSMSAFFSGTDDNDDKKGLRISGVFGKLNTDKTQHKWRFNYYAKKFELQLQDIFEMEKISDTVEYPQEWLGKVSTIHTHTPSRMYQPGFTVGNRPAPNPRLSRSGANDTRKNTDNQSHVFPVMPVIEYIEDGKPILRDANGRACKPHRTIKNQFEFDFMVRPFTKKAGGQYENYLGKRAVGQDSIDLESFDPTSSFRDDSRELDDAWVDEFQLGFSFGGYSGSSDTPPEDIVEDDDREETLKMDRQISENLKNGINFIESDEVLLDLIKHAYDRLSPEGQAKLQTEGM